MESGQYIRTLAEFVTGEIELPRFRQLIEDRIFELNQKPGMTDEKRLLSSIELYLHEAEEGLRDENEVYAQAQFIIDNIILQKLTSNDVNIPTALPLAVPKTRYLLSKTFDVDIEHSDTKQKELPMLAPI